MHAAYGWSMRLPIFKVGRRLAIFCKERVNVFTKEKKCK